MLLDERITSELSGLYPNGIISGLSVKNLALHNEINRLAKRKNTSYSHYIESLGFTSENTRGRNGKSYEEKVEDVLVELNECFPDKTIESFHNQPLYARIYNLCKQSNMDMNDFLIQQGFTYKNFSGQTQTHTQQDAIDIRKSKIKYDVDTLRTLCTDFGLSQMIFSDLFEVSRQAISGIINRKNKYSNNWIVTDLDPSTLSTFEQMITDYEKEYTTENEQFYICSDGNIENPNLCLFYTLKIENEVLCQCLYDIPTELKDALLQRHFHLFKTQHLQFIKELHERDQEFSTKSEPYYLLKEERETANFLIKNYTHVFHDFPAFIDYFGFQHIVYIRDRRDALDERYYQILSSHYVHELDIVKIPSGHKDYTNMSRVAKQRGMGLKGFIESFGFNYKRVVNINLEQRKEKYLNILSPYILEDGKIYLSSFDPVYTRFYILAYKSNRTLTDYLKEEFDLDRYTHINDVPAHLTPKIEKTTYTEAKEEALIERIMDYFLMDEELKTIYIPTISSFYWDLYKYCDTLDKDIDEVVTGWGFTRLKKNQLAIQEEEPLSTEDIVEVLTGMQTSINKEETETSRQKRSQRLVNLLKEMYDYKCQLCGDHPLIPNIPMDNGKNYVEVHHIVPLHNQNVMNDESDFILDDYENAIVVCAHHHKVLHYENSGYVDVKQLNEEFYFINTTNKIHIKKNYHLSENDHLVSKLINTIKIM